MSQKKVTKKVKAKKIIKNSNLNENLKNEEAITKESNYEMSDTFKEIRINIQRRFEKYLKELLESVNILEKKDFYKNVLIVLLKEYFIYREKIQYFQCFSSNLSDDDEDFLWNVLDDSKFVELADLFKNNFKVISEDGGNIEDIKCEYISDLDNVFKK